MKTEIGHVRPEKPTISNHTLYGIVATEVEVGLDAKKGLAQLHIMSEEINVRS